MKRHSKNNYFLSLALVASMLLPAAAYSASVNLATVPLASATTTSVLPNLMFILDNSGSMGQDYTPDYMSDIFNSPATNDKQCRDSGDDDGGTVYSGPANGGTRVLDTCVVGDPLYMNSDMNSQYYNPAIRYTPGVNADGTSKPSQTDPTNVLTDAYGVQKRDQLNPIFSSSAPNITNTTVVNNVNLATGYPDRVWCTTQSPSAANLIDPAVCRKNSDYLYPNATYKYGRSDGGTPDQQVTKAMLNGVIKVSGAPYYYSVVPTEYCKAADLKECTLSSVPTGLYTFPAKSRWCDSAALTNCQSVKASTFVWPRYVGVSSVPGVAASGSITMKNQSSTSGKSVSSIKVGSVQILGATVNGSGAMSSLQLATAIANQINTFNSNPEYTATAAGNVITITSTVAAGATANGITATTKTSNTINSQTNMTGGVTGISAVPPYTFTRTDIVAGTYPKATSRTDCAGATCSYTEEITNFSNWYAYYRTRMQAMKSAASLAFKPIDSRYRVGFITIANQSSNYLPIAKFDAGAGSQKEQWYTKLFGINPSTGTPLRSALSIVGRIYAGKNPVGSSDPVQYSCQQNFALLTTDGYWNTDTASAVKDVTGSASVGNRDGGSTPRPMYEGPTASLNSLADVAKYYYDTDLRDSGLSNCAGSLGLDVCENNVFVSGTDNNVKQHMTTFTLGLGVDGTLLYSGDYKTATSGDYYNLKNGFGTPTVNWPLPVADTETAVDDLWHAAVNGQGTYFSAKDPAQLTKGLSDALSQINSKVGAGAAAATSTLNPVAGDNFAYVASYTTVKWTGNLEARTINLTTGEVSEAATWCVEDVVNASCAAPSSIVAETSGGSTNYFCVTPSAASCNSPAVWGDGVTTPTTSCKLEVPRACTGTLRPKVASVSDTRSIKMKSGGGLTDFTYANLSAAQKTNFESAFLSTNLSQWTSLDPTTQQPFATGANLVNYLRGQTGFEDSASNTALNRLFRYREAVMGDALESAPVFVGKPIFSYTDAGYDAFKIAQASRAGTVYIGTNDGMLHAFNSSDGTERWAYVPSMVIPNMWKLADKNYSTIHTNYVNGTTTISDVCISNCTSAGTAVWKTILIGGLNGGGKGYYALDITDPATPVLLWEFDTTSDGDLGYSFGNPVITKKADGTWVVLVTSGYNNVSPGNGQGYLYVLGATDGSIISRMSTGVGDTITPSGLAKIVSWVDNPSKNNTATYTYGGDLLGNLWRFDINAAAAVGSNPLLFATLKDSGGNPQPITTRPELGKISGNRVVFVGTGKYLEISDLTDTQQQTLYAIKDNAAGVTLNNPRTTLVEQTLSNAGANRIASNNAVDFSTGNGWFIDLPDTGERQNVAGRLISGTLLVPTTVPSNTVCSPGGYGWFNYLNYKTGGAPDLSTGMVSSKTNAPIVGFNYIYINGKPVVSVVTSDKPTPQLVPDTKFATDPSGFAGKRAIWRELIE